MAEYIEREKLMQKFADHVKRSNNSDFAPVPTWNQIVQIVEDSPAADVVERKEAIPIDWIWKHADEFYSASQRHSDAPFSEDAMEDREYVEAIKARGVLSRLATSYRFELKSADMRGDSNV